jgi:hypothetical protein
MLRDERHQVHRSHEPVGRPFFRILPEPRAGYSGGGPEAPRSCVSRESFSRLIRYDARREGETSRLRAVAVGGPVFGCLRDVGGADMPTTMHHDPDAACLQGLGGEGK